MQRVIVWVIQIFVHSDQARLTVLALTPHKTLANKVLAQFLFLKNHFTCCRRALSTSGGNVVRYKLDVTVGRRLAVTCKQ